jgi:hypothetical protein
MVLGILFTSCATTSELTKTEVIRIANTETQRRGYNLNSFTMPSVCYNCFDRSSRDDRWWVCYDPKQIKHGADNHLCVIIKGQTREIWGFNAGN